MQLSRTYPFPIVPEGTRDKHDAVGHLSNDGRVHVFNTGIGRENRPERCGAGVQDQVRPYRGVDCSKFRYWLMSKAGFYFS